MKSFILLSVFSLLISCATTSSKNEVSQFQLRSFTEEKLSNGLSLLWIRDQSLPRISFQLLLPSGSFVENKEKMGITSFTASLLEEGGTEFRSAEKIAEDLAQIGAEFGYSVNSDMMNISASGLSPSKSELLKIYSEMILHPQFSDAEVERRRSVILATIAKNKDQPSLVVDQELDRQIFSEHPYAWPSVGNKKSIESIKASDLKEFYKTYFRPNQAYLAVVGHFDEAFQQEVRQLFSAWKQQNLPVRVTAQVQMKPREVVLIHKPGLQQTQIRWGHLGIRRSDPDFMSFRLAQIILGGAFASRLNQKIRDDLGLTYSISSSSDARVDYGSVDISTFTRHDKAITTILETEKLLVEFHKNGVRQEELDAAKAYLIGQFPAALETAEKFAGNLLSLRRYGISDQYLQNFIKNVQGISKKEVNEAIQKHFFPNQLQLVIYSDESQLQKEIGPIGLYRKIVVE